VEYNSRGQRNEAFAVSTAHRTSASSAFVQTESHFVNDRRIAPPGEAPTATGLQVEGGMPKMGLRDQILYSRAVILPDFDW